MHPEDLTAGSYVSVFRGPRLQVRNSRGEFVAHQENAALNGSVLKVHALSLPYVAVEVLYSHGGYEKGQRVGLDTRQVEFVRIDIDYARALSKLPLENPEAGGRHAAQGDPASAGGRGTRAVAAHETATPASGPTRGESEFIGWGYGRCPECGRTLPMHSPLCQRGPGSQKNT